MSEKKKAAGLPLGRALALALSSLKMNLRCMSRFSLAIGAAGFVMALWPSLISQLYARLTDNLQGLFASARPWTAALWSLLALTAAYLIQVAYDYAHEVCAARDEQAIVKHIKATVMACAGRAEYRYIHHDADFRDRMAFTEMFGTAEMAKGAQQVLLALQHLLSVTAMGVFLWRVNPWLVFALLAATVPSLLITASQRDEDYKAKTKHMKNSAMSVHLFYMAAGANERCKSLLDMRFNNLFPWIKERWRQTSGLYLQEKRALTRRFLWWNMLADVLRNGVYVVILLLTAKDIFQSPALGLGTFTMVLTLSQQAQGRLGKLLGSALGFFAGTRYMEDYQAILSVPKEEAGEAAKDFSRACIRYEKVSFTYPGGSRAALKDVSVTIRPGEKIAIVGENGSGKSTFVNLLCGLYAPTHGSVTLDGCPVTGALASARKAIAFVPQNFGRYEASIRENVTLAEPERQIAQEELAAMAQSVGALEFISGQPKGFNEAIGTFSETGNNLSGGQWQKLALMRALYRKDAGILILDEPTAALDPQAEASLYRSLRSLAGDRTALLISHRLGICTTVDRILVFEDGRLVEDGSHASLMQKGGAYARLYQAQAAWYA